MTFSEIIGEKEIIGEGCYYKANVIMIMVCCAVLCCSFKLAHKTLNFLISDPTSTAVATVCWY